MQLLTALTLLVLPSTTLPQEELAAPDIHFRPAVIAGQTFTGSFRLSSSDELVEWRQLQGGEELPAGVTPRMEKSSARSVSVAFEETVAAVEDGVPTRITRTYGELAGEHAIHMSFGLEGAGAAEGVDEEAELTSVLAEESVVFAMDEDEGRLLPEPAEGSELDEGDVAGLRADMSLGLLAQPGDEALPRGAAWKLEPSVLEELMDYPGDLKLRDDDGEGPHRSLGLGSDEDEEPELEGELVLTYATAREIEGRAIAIIEVSGEVVRTTDATHEAAMMVEGGGGEGDVAEIHVTTVETLTPRGELHWDIELGVFVGLELEIETAAEVSELSSFDIPGMGEFEIEQVEVMEGTVELSYARRPAS